MTLITSHVANQRFKSHCTQDNNEVTRGDY
jgi:hypothetical protein